MREQVKQCVWIPEIRKSGRVSTMFHRTDCGISGAASFGERSRDNWKHCPYCGRPLLISINAHRLRS